MMAIPGIRELTESEFARTSTIRRGQLAWLLGAGTSSSAGVSTAGQMIAEFKAALFASAHGLDRRELDSDDPIWVERINRYFDDANGFPPVGSPREYEAAFTAMYPASEDRRRYIAQAVERGNPSYGQRIFGALLATGSIPEVFTTNFDSLIEQATSSANQVLPTSERRHLRVSAIDNSEIAQRCLAQSDWPLLAKIHGDYLSDSIKNTASELQTQDTTMRLVLTQSMNRFGLVVAGYSGRDDSVMEALEEALRMPSPYPNGLFWIVRSSTRLLPRVRAFLDSAFEAGVETNLVISETFDELASEILRQAELPPQILEALKAVSPAPELVEVAIPTLEAASFPVLRFNALPILEMPTRFITASLDIENRELRASLKERRSRVDAISNGQLVIALGSDTDLLNALGPQSQSLVLGVRPADPSGSTLDHGLLFQSLARALTRDRPLRAHYQDRGHELYLINPASVKDDAARARVTAALVPFREAYGPDILGSLKRFDNRRYAEGVRLRMEQRLGTWWLLFEPFTWVEPHPRRTRPDPVAPWIKDRWYKRRNKQWAQMFAVWSSVLAPHSETELMTWEHHDSTRFVLGATTAWAVPGQGGRV